MFLATSYFYFLAVENARLTTDPVWAGLLRTTTNAYVNNKFRKKGERRKLISGTKKLTSGNVVIGELKVPGLNPGQVSEPFYCLS